MANEIEQVTTNNGLRGEVAALGHGISSVYSSIEATDFESRLRTATAVSDSKPIREHLGEVIALVDVVIQVIPMENEDTKQLEDVTRVILIDAEGNSFHAISGVLFKDVQNLIGILGKPSSWPEPVSVAVREDGNGRRRFMTLTLV